MFSRLALVAAVGMGLASCEESRGYRGNARHNVPIPGELYALMSEKAVAKDDPILIRSYKKESELEIWKRGRDGQYVLLKTYPMCRWSGQLGPKKREGDRQAPEGFYSINQSQMNPNSAFYLSFNMGYPNAYDRAHGRSGAHLMVHGACSSAGCYSMTDDQIGEIYALSREAHNGGQKAIQMQALPFRMTPENLAKHRLDANMPFWKNLKEGTDIFEVTKREPKVAMCSQRYAFGTEGAGGLDGECNVRTDASVASAASEKRRRDEVQVAELVAKGTPAVRLVYEDGDQHHSFKQILAQSGSEGLHAKATWASRDVGISRADALASGPKVVVLDQAGKPRGAVQASSSDGETVLAAARQLEDQKVAEAAKPATDAKPVTDAKPAVATATAAKPAATRSASQIAASTRTVAANRAAATTEVARTEAQPAKGEDKSVLQRMMALNPFGQ
jgi:murein L,D-transpeptidase YafK